MTAARAAIGSPYLESARSRRTAAVLSGYLPTELDGFLDPDLDGGSLAIHVLERHPAVRVTLASTSAAVIAVWRSVRSHPEALVAAVAFHADRHDPRYFAAVRDAVAGGRPGRDGEPGAAETEVEQAAAFVYLRGAAHPDAQGRPLQEFSGARYGRDTVAFDASNLRQLGRLLQHRDVTLEHRPPFELLGGIAEGDLVLLDPPGGPQPDARELRSLVGAITARAGLVLAPAAPVAPAGAGDSSSGGWPAASGLVRIGEHDGLAVWANGGLRRALRTAP